jgi:glutathione S-transferase
VERLPLFFSFVFHSHSTQVIIFHLPIPTSKIPSLRFIVLMHLLTLFFLGLLFTAQAMTTPKNIKLTYFDIEAAAEPVRLALALAHVEYEDIRVKFPDWPTLKPTTPYGQLPTMTYDGGRTMTQSPAMLRWVGNLDESKALYPVDKLYEIEEAIGLIEDMKRAWTPSLYLGMRPANFGYPDDFASTDEGKAVVKALREKFTSDELPVYLKYFEDMIERNGGKFLCGDKPTIADCLVVPTIRNWTKGHVDHVPVTCIKDFSPKIAAYVENFCALAEIKGRYTNGLGA